GPAAAAGGEAAGYRIYANGGLQGSVAGDVLTYTVSGLASGTSYGFKVVAVDANDEEHGLLERTASTVYASNGYVPPSDPPSSGGKTEEDNGGDNGETEEDNDFDSERVPLFGDIAGDHPAWEAIAEALERGIVTGYADKTFKPQAPVTRAA
ncbi:S-layer homology domain-containing protein, partial [Paenibacillus agaridevorans]|uniref:S-layer homology domain-containing protein n=1 Tax=Paenibacillus agaridevorans TaxID=171404 RepID=UPI002159F742